MADETDASLILSAVQTARSSAEWLHYTSGGLIAGGGAVVVAMMLGGVQIQRPTYVGFELIYGLLLMVGGWLGWRMMPSITQHKSAALLAIMLLPGVPAVYIVIDVVVNTSSSRFFPVMAYTFRWWQLIAIALAATFFGCQQRITADRGLEILKSLEKTIEAKIRHQAESQAKEMTRSREPPKRDKLSETDENNRITTDEAKH